MPKFEITPKEDASKEEMIKALSNNSSLSSNKTYIEKGKVYISLPPGFKHEDDVNAAETAIKETIGDKIKDIEFIGRVARYWA